MTSFEEDGFFEFFVEVEGGFSLLLFIFGRGSPEEDGGFGEVGCDEGCTRNDEF